jgi:hypothetical protein
MGLPARSQYHLPHALTGSLFFLLFFALPWLLDAQSQLASIAGVVTDPGKNAVPSAQVRARSAETGAVRATINGLSGQFEIPRLKRGPYSYVQQWTASIEKSLGKETTLEIGYQGERRLHLQRAHLINKGRVRWDVGTRIGTPAESRRQPGLAAPLGTDRRE